MASHAVISRAQATADRLPRYFSGEPCPQGHVAERWTADCKCVECGRARDRARRAAKSNGPVVAMTPEERKAKADAWRRANPQYKRDYYRAHPEKWRADWQNRRARVRSSEGKHSSADVRRIHAAQRGCCAVCNISLKKRFEVDHIIPLARGGSNYPKNLQLLCGPCNRQKGANDPVEFMRRLGRLI